MKPSLKDRLMPPICNNINDWITMWSFILTGISLIAWLMSMFFAQEYQLLIFQVLGFMGGLTIGRISVTIEPQNK